MIVGNDHHGLSFVQHSNCCISGFTRDCISFLWYLVEYFSCATLMSTVLLGKLLFITKGSLLVGVRSVAQKY